MHVVFDNPGSMKETPKELEQKRRDNNADKTRVAHTCKDLNCTTSIPTNWHALLACKTCKKCLTQYIAEEMITLVPSMLSRNQTFFCNKQEIAFSVTSCNEILPCIQLWTNVDEADMRIWLHSVHSIGTFFLLILTYIMWDFHLHIYYKGWMLLYNLQRHFEKGQSSITWYKLYTVTQICKEFPLLFTHKHYNPSMYAQDVIMCPSLEAWGK